MDKRNRNIITIGALTIVSVAIFVTLLYWLLGNPVLRGGMDVLVKLDNAVGLKRADRVQLQGVEIGSVRDVQLNPDGGVLVKLRVDDKLALTSDTRATISGDVFGAHTIQLVPGRAMMSLADGDTIEGLTAPQLTDMAADLSNRATTILTSADSLLSPQFVGDLRQTAAMLPVSAAEMRAMFAELRLAAASLRRSTGELETAESGAALAAAISRVEQSSRSVAAAAESLDRSMASMHSVLAKIDNGNGTLGLLVNDSSLYVELNEAVREIRALATDIRERPNRYIDIRFFGRRPD